MSPHGQGITRRWMLRRAGAAGAIGLLAGLLAACGGAPAPTPTTAAAKPAAAEPPKAAVPAATEAPKAAASAAGAGQPVKLTKMAWGSALEKQNIEDGLKTFEKQNPGITVEYIHTPQDYDAKLQTMLAGGTAPDVFKTSGGNYPDYVKKGALMDITDRLMADH